MRFRKGDYVSFPACERRERGTVLDDTPKNAAFVGIETEAGKEIYVSLKGVRVIKKAAIDFSALDENMALLAFSKTIEEQSR